MRRQMIPLPSGQDEASMAQLVVRLNKWLNRYPVTVIITFLVAFSSQTILGLYRPFGIPTIWAMNETHQTMFALNRESVCIYWNILDILQFMYIFLLCSGIEDGVDDPITLNAHIAAYNILNVLWIGFWVSSQFWLGQVCLVINFLHLWWLYLNNNLGRDVYLSFVAGPLAWTFFGFFMNGAALLDGHTQISEVVGYVFILAIFLVWMSVVLVYKDYCVGFCFSFLFISLAVQQSVIGNHEHLVFSASVIGALFFVASLTLIILEALGKELTIRHNDEFDDEFDDENEEGHNDEDDVQNEEGRDDGEFERLWEEASEIGEDDHLAAEEEAAERSLTVAGHFEGSDSPSSAQRNN